MILVLLFSACRRQDKEPNEHSRLCSCHFSDGEKKHGPTLFPRSVKRVFDFPDPEPKKARLSSR